KVQERLALPDEAVRFLLYHGDNDAEHMKEFEALLGMVLPDPFIAARIVTTAKVTARLYALPLEEAAACDTRSRTRTRSTPRGSTPRIPIRGWRCIWTTACRSTTGPSAICCWGPGRDRGAGCSRWRGRWCSCSSVW